MKRLFGFLGHTLFLATTISAMETVDPMQLQQQEQSASAFNPSHYWEIKSEKDKFNWQDLPQDLKNRIYYEYVGVDLPGSLIQFFEENGTENGVGTDYNYTEKYFSNIQKLVTLTTDKVHIWNPSTGHLIWCKSCPNNNDKEKSHFTAFNLSQIKGLLACGTDKGRVLLYDLATGQEREEFCLIDAENYKGFQVSPVIRSLFFDSQNNRIIGTTTDSKFFRDMITGKINRCPCKFTKGLDPVYVWPLSHAEQVAHYRYPSLSRKKTSATYCQSGISCATRDTNDHTKVLIIKDIYNNTNGHTIHELPHDGIVKHFLWRSPISNGVIQKWRTYLPSSDGKRRQVDPLFAYLVLSKIAQAIDQRKQMIVLTDKENTYFEMINEAFHDAIKKQIKREYQLIRWFKKILKY